MLATLLALSLYVVDGDTIILGTERIRISNIDAPELHGKCDAEVRLAIAARRRLAGLLSDMTPEVRREGTDRYGRTLARLYVGDQDVGELLVSESLARPWMGRREPWCTTIN